MWHVSIRRTAFVPAVRSALVVRHAQIASRALLSTTARALVDDPSRNNHQHHHHHRKPTPGLWDRTMTEARKMFNMLTHGSKELAKQTAHSVDILRKPTQRSRADILHLRQTFLDEDTKRKLGGDLMHQRALAKNILDDVNTMITWQTGSPDDGIDNAIRSEWQNIRSLYASPSGVLYEHLRTEPMQQLTRNMWRVEDLTREQQNLCAQLFFRNALLFPDLKLTNHLRFILEDDDMLRDLGVSSLSPDELAEALIDRGFHATFLEGHSETDRREFLTRWLAFTDGLEEEDKSAIVLARALSAH